MGGNHQHGHHHGSHHHDHGHGDNKVYDHLLNRLDANPVTIPKTPLVKQVLALLFNNEEAELLCSMPGEFTAVDTISRISGFPYKKAEKMLENMADRGMVFDFDRNGEKYYLLLPAIPGFIEFSLATKNNNIPQKDAKRIVSSIKLLGENPRPPQCQKLSADEKYRLRVGVYRILYSVEDEKLIIYVVKVAHRKDIYRKRS